MRPYLMLLALVLLATPPFVSVSVSQQSGGGIGQGARIPPNDDGDASYCKGTIEQEPDGYLGLTCNSGCGAGCGYAAVSTSCGIGLICECQSGPAPFCCKPTTSACGDVGTWGDCNSGGCSTPAGSCNASPPPGGGPGTWYASCW